MTDDIAYLDNASTTKVCPQAIKAVVEAMENEYGNPSSLHRMGVQATKILTKAREIIAAQLGCESECVYFTSGGSEANNTAIFGAANSRRERHIVVTAVEHGSVIGTMKRLSQLGWDVSFIAPEADGTINAQKILAAIRPDTALVSMMLVNNETGNIFPVAEVAQGVKRIAPRAIIHCDGVQALGKIPLKVNRMGIDLMSVSGHKIGAPKGVGALYIRRNIHIIPLIHGGGQEKGMRSGTEDVPMIAGFGAACEGLDIKASYDRTRILWNYLYEKLEALPGIQIISNNNGSPYIFSFSVVGYKAETMLHFLESRNVFVSSGSACSKGATSPVLTAMKLSNEIVNGTLRASFLYDTKYEELDRLVSALTEGMKQIAH